MTSGDQLIEVAFDFLRAHLAGMAFSIEEDELTYPVDIRLFSSVTEMLLSTGD
jgi:hypothetical protein